jgi:hypothetical protein
MDREKRNDGTPLLGRFSEDSCTRSRINLPVKRSSASRAAGGELEPR